MKPSLLLLVFGFLPHSLFAASAQNGKASASTGALQESLKKRISQVLLDTRAPFSEAEGLLVAGESYLIHYEDEEGLGQVVSPGVSLKLSFSDDDIVTFKKAVQIIREYRSFLKTKCQTESSRTLASALDRYGHGLTQFHRRGLVSSSDITENNSHFTLLVNRSLLKDAPVLISRHLQHKRHRFKDQIDQFGASDKTLVESLVSVAKVFKLELTDEDWNRTYSLRDPQVESVSLWPRESIFAATDRLGDVREKACAVPAPK